MWKTVLVTIIFLGSMSISAQSEDKKISEIRQIYKETSDRITKAEKNFPESDIYFSEMTVNKGGTRYPAVGNFKESIKFYYTFGNREENPYPNRLLKILTKTERAGRVEQGEYLFNSGGQLIFSFEKTEETENRFYFSGRKLIRWQKGEQTINPDRPEAQDTAKSVLSRNDKLIRIFRNSLE